MNKWNKFPRNKTFIRGFTDSHNRRNQFCENNSEELILIILFSVNVGFCLYAYARCGNFRSWFAQIERFDIHQQLTILRWIFYSRENKIMLWTIRIEWNSMQNILREFF